MSVRLEVVRSEAVPTSLYVPDDGLLQRWADGACQLDGELEASLRIVDSEESRRLNNDYRGKDRSTNVLSFPMEMPLDLPEEIGSCLLGDLAVCAEVIAREAGEQHKPMEAHWAHMIVHGMLHLQGYNHIGHADAERMESLEKAIMRRLGYDNPYHDD